MTLLLGDCLEVMPTLEAGSVDAVVTDPPYGLEFMGREWDKLGAVTEPATDTPKWRAGHGGLGPASASGGTPFGGGGTRVRYGKSARTMQDWHQRWATEAFRVAKPGAYLLAFGGTRTYHRLTCAIEDAGWIIRDCLVWAYASGFPKSRALLKPAWEPIVMARKPGPLRELAIDACRIPGAVPQVTQGLGGPPTSYSPRRETRLSEPSDLGRWPANVILTNPIFDGDTPGVVGGGPASNGGEPTDVRGRGGIWHDGDGVPAGPQYGDSGTYSRFFLIPKAARSEREPVLGGLATRGDLNKVFGDVQYVATCEVCAARLPNATVEHCGRPVTRVPEKRPARVNVHPTVKSLDLMRHLVRLVTPTGGTVLDPFAGSGTTLLAAELEGFPWVGIEREPEYVAIIEARLNGTQRGLGLDVGAPTPTRPTRRDGVIGGNKLGAHFGQFREIVPAHPHSEFCVDPIHDGEPA